MRHVDRAAHSAGDLKGWARITTAFRLTEDPGASFALFSSLEAVIEMAEQLGFDALAPVAKALPIIRAVNEALLRLPDETRLKLGNPRLGTHRCSKSPAEFPLLCCFTTEIGDENIVSRIVALRSLVLVVVVFESDRSAQLTVVADGLRKAQTLPPTPGPTWFDDCRAPPRRGSDGYLQRSRALRRVARNLNAHVVTAPRRLRSLPR